MSSSEAQPRQSERDPFLEALERTTPGERAVFVDQAFTHDTSIRAAVEALRRHHKEDSFMGSPAVALSSPDAATQTQPGSAPR